VPNPIPRVLPWFLLTAAACSGGDGGDPVKFEFVDAAERAGVTVKVVCGDPRRWYIPESNGSGAAWLDYDGDGDVDLFVGNGGRLKYLEDGKKLQVERGEGCRLYRNDKDWRFADVTAAAGAECFDWVNGVSAGDLDNDGDPDLYLASFGEDRYLRNDRGKFTDATKESGLTNPKWAAHAAFGDADNDGDLDVYVANYCEFDVNAPPDEGMRNVVNGVEVAYGPEGENPGFNAGAPDVFFVNDGKGRFRDATKEAGLELPKALCSYAAIFADVDNDGLADILVANDAQPSNLFHNLGKSAFREEGEARGFAYGADGKATAAMGLSAFDFDEDGDLDIFKSNFDMEANSLYVNDGKGRFVDRAGELGLAAPSMDKLGWGCGFADLDNDGDLDLVVANGHVYPQGEQIGMHGWLQKTQLYEAVRGVDGTPRYRDATASAGPGFAPLASSRGVAIGDPDDDGDLDMVVIDLDERPRLLENRTPSRGNWIAVKLQGLTSNRDGVGAKVTVHAGGRRYFQEARPVDGLYSTNDSRLHFGLGPGVKPDRIEVAWPSGIQQKIVASSVNETITIEEPQQ
jgi:hypothetical protein